MSSESTTRVRERFRAEAERFDRLYEDTSWLQRRLRPTLHLRRLNALALVERLGEPRVLDVGCGSGRIGEDALERGAREYVGIDFADEMVALAHARLERFGRRARLVHADFLVHPFDAPFDLVLALGVFDYVDDPERFARRTREVCCGLAAASFPRWTWVEGPIRRLDTKSSAIARSSITDR